MLLLMQTMEEYKAKMMCYMYKFTSLNYHILIYLSIRLNDDTNQSDFRSCLWVRWRWRFEIQLDKRQRILFLHLICCFWCSNCTREERLIVFKFQLSISRSVLFQMQKFAMEITALWKVYNIHILHIFPEKGICISVFEDFRFMQC